MTITSTLIDALLNQVLRGVDYSISSSLYVSLHTANPTHTGANEVSATAWPSYARQDTTAGGAASAAFSAPSSGQSTNQNALDFGANDGAADVTVTHFAIWDAASGGNVLYHNTLVESLTIRPDDECVFKAGKLTVSMS